MGKEEKKKAEKRFFNTHFPKEKSEGISPFNGGFLSSTIKFLPLSFPFSSSPFTSANSTIRGFSLSLNRAIFSYLSLLRGGFLPPFELVSPLGSISLHKYNFPFSDFRLGAIINHCCYIFVWFSCGVFPNLALNVLACRKFGFLMFFFFFFWN